MTDRELLELEAKAAGIEITWALMGDTYAAWLPNELLWNPLEDDGDALRLAVLLRFWVKDFAPYEGFNGEQPFGMIEIWRETDDDPIYVEWYKPGEDRITVTRRAIVLAAAETGKNLK